MTPQELAIQLNLMASLANAPALTDPALFTWVQQSLATGTTPAALIARLQADRHCPVAVATVLVTLAQQNLEVRPHGTASTPASPTPNLPGPVVPNRTQIGDRSIPCRWSMVKDEFQARLYDQFITPAEIAHLQALATPRLTSSLVIAPDFGSQASPVRTSQQTFLASDPRDTILSAINARISALVGIPMEHGEDLQILHYLQAGEYKPHFDYFSPATPRERKIMAYQGGNRVGTFLIYLSEVEAGGSTFFPHLGVSIHPYPGQALWFSYPPAASGSPSQLSQHAGSPIITGEKWLATRWFRERPFVNRRPPLSA